MKQSVRLLSAALGLTLAGLAQAEWLMEIDVIAVVPDQA